MEVVQTLSITGGPFPSSRAVCHRAAPGLMAIVHGSTFTVMDLFTGFRRGVAEDAGATEPDAACIGAEAIPYADGDSGPARVVAVDSTGRCTEWTMEPTTLVRAGVLPVRRIWIDKASPFAVSSSMPDAIFFMTKTRTQLQVISMSAGLQPTVAIPILAVAGADKPMLCNLAAHPTLPALFTCDTAGVLYAVALPDPNAEGGAPSLAGSMDMNQTMGATSHIARIATHPTLPLVGIVTVQGAALVLLWRNNAFTCLAKCQVTNATHAADAWFHPWASVMYVMSIAPASVHAVVYQGTAQLRSNIGSQYLIDRLLPISDASDAKPRFVRRYSHVSCPIVWCNTNGAIMLPEYAPVVAARIPSTHEMPPEAHGLVFYVQRRVGFPDSTSRDITVLSLQVRNFDAKNSAYAAARRVCWLPSTGSARRELVVTGVAPMLYQRTVFVAVRLQACDNAAGSELGLVVGPLSLDDLLSDKPLPAKPRMSSLVRGGSAFLTDCGRVALLPRDGGAVVVSPVIQEAGGERTILPTPAKIISIFRGPPSPIGGHTNDVLAIVSQWQERSDTAVVAVVPFGKLGEPLDPLAPRLQLLPDEKLLQAELSHWKPLITTTAEVDMLALRTNQRLVILASGFQVLAQFAFAVDDGTRVPPIASFVWSGPAVIAATVDGLLLCLSCSGSVRRVGSMDCRTEVPVLLAVEGVDLVFAQRHPDTGRTQVCRRRFSSNDLTICAEIDYATNGLTPSDLRKFAADNSKLDDRKAAIMQPSLPAVVTCLRAGLLRHAVILLTNMPMVHRRLPAWFVVFIALSMPNFDLAEHVMREAIADLDHQLVETNGEYPDMTSLPVSTSPVVRLMRRVATAFLAVGRTETAARLLDLASADEDLWVLMATSAAGKHLTISSGRTARLLSTFAHIYASTDGDNGPCEDRRHHIVSTGYTGPHYAAKSAIGYGSGELPKVITLPEAQHSLLRWFGVPAPPSELPINPLAEPVAAESGGGAGGGAALAAGAAAAAAPASSASSSSSAADLSLGPGEDSAVLVYSRFEEEPDVLASGFPVTLADLSAYQHKISLQGSSETLRLVDGDAPIEVESGGTIKQSHCVVFLAGDDTTCVLAEIPDKFGPLFTAGAVGPLTIEAWVYLEEVRAISVCECRTPAGTVDWVLRLTDSGAPEFYVPATDERITSAVKAVPEQDWRHVALVIAKGGGVKLYINASEVAAGKVANKGPVDPKSGQARTLMFGKGLAGQLTELRVWGVERSKSDLTANYDTNLGLAVGRKQKIAVTIHPSDCQCETCRKREEDANKAFSLSGPPLMGAPPPPAGAARRRRGK